MNLWNIADLQTSDPLTIGWEPFIAYCYLFGEWVGCWNSSPPEISVSNWILQDGRLYEAALLHLQNHPDLPINSTEKLTGCAPDWIIKPWLGLWYNARVINLGWVYCNSFVGASCVLYTLLIVCWWACNQGGVKVHWKERSRGSFWILSLRNLGLGLWVGVGSKTKPL